MDDIKSRLRAYPVGKDWRSGEEFLRPESTGELVATVREAAAYIERLEAALERQCDNMAFVVNHVSLYGFYDRLQTEMEQDRNTLKGGKDGKDTTNDHA